MPRNLKPVSAPRAALMQPQQSWGIESWPPSVWPNTVDRARYVVRANRDSLVLAGALSRVGRRTDHHRLSLSALVGKAFRQRAWLRDRAEYATR